MLSLRAFRSEAKKHLINNPDVGQTRDIFAQGNCPFNFGEENTDLAPIINMMHADRFEPLLAEIGGFSPNEKDVFVAALAEHFLFQRIMFPSHRAQLPIDDMMAQFVVAKKILKLKPQAKRVLEIGPGSGNLAFFFRDISLLAQTDVSPSFYVLQSLVNSFLFGAAFDELALARADSPDVADFPPSCVHYPWWELGQIEGQTFDVVTSNANWNEMTAAARQYYLALCSRVLTPEGIIVSQCLGGNFTGLDWTGARDLIWADFIYAGFRPVFFVNRGNTTAPGKFERLLNPICLGQAVLVPRTHPWWSRGFESATDFACIEEPLIYATYFRSADGKLTPSREDLKQAVKALLAGPLRRRWTRSWPFFARVKAPPSTLSSGQASAYR